MEEFATGIKMAEREGLKPSVKMADYDKTADFHVAFRCGQ